MFTVRSHIWMLLVPGFFLGCADSGALPRPQKSSANTKVADAFNGASNPKVYWMQGSKDAMPSGPIPMGTISGKTVYLCRAKVGNAVLLGPVTVDGSCIVPSNGSTFYSDIFEVLTLRDGKDANLVLEDVTLTPGQIPDKAVHGGTEYDFETFACRTLVSGNTYVGKTHKGYAGCLYFDGFSEKDAAIYSVLALR